MYNFFFYFEIVSFFFSICLIYLTDPFSKTLISSVSYLWMYEYKLIIVAYYWKLVFKHKCTVCLILSLIKNISFLLFIIPKTNECVKVYHSEVRKSNEGFSSEDVQ